MVQIDAAKDLAALFNPPQQERYSGMRYGQGTILSWNPETFENTIDFRGITLTNVPVEGGTDALTYQPGDVVGLTGWAPNGGFGSWRITGRIIIPGAGVAEQQIAFLTTTLGEAVARAVIGASVFYDQVAAGATRDAFGTFGDIAQGGTPSPGPEVSFELTGTKFIAIWGAAVNASVTAAVATRAAGFMDVDVVGPTPTGPSIISVRKDRTMTDHQLFADDSLAFSEQFDGLTPGSYTVTATYRVDDHGGGLSSISWGNRWLLVIAF